jgi:uncharacterized membrane protein
MTPSSTVGLLWLVFAGTHIGLATPGLRGRLVARLGTTGFTLLYFVVASVSFTALVGTYAVLRDDGAPGLAAGATLRSVAIALIALGVILSVAGLLPYSGSSYAVFRTTSRLEPRGIERITRHPFFVGTAMLGAGHALVASRLVGVVFFGLLAIFSLGGAWLQDRKLVALRGSSHATFVARSSLVPFAAILAGRQRLVLRELGVVGPLLGIAAAWGLRSVHSHVFDHGGAYVVLAVVGGALVVSLQAWQREALRERSLLERLLGPALVLIGVGHGAAAFVLFPDGLAAIARDGVVGAISNGSSGDVKAAFWFALFTPALVFLGWVASHALVRDDHELLSLLAWFLVGTGMLGVVVMPVSGFWLVLAVGIAMSRVAPPRPCNVAERPL